MTAVPIRIAFVGTFPPTACGIATFTRSLRDAVVAAAPEAVTAGVIRVVPEPSASSGDGVVSEWSIGEPRSRHEALAVAGRYDCVIVQHEFGIYGADDGAEVVDFVEACAAPVITVLHTVLPDPTSRQRRIVERLAGASALTVTQTRAALERLVARHHLDGAVLAVVPHGAVANFGGPRLPLTTDGRPSVLTWGLIGQGKGIEHGIRAVALLTEPPAPVYFVAGRTHPNVVASEGETYRGRLVELAEQLGVSDRVVFDAAYRSFPALRAMIRGADVVLLPYDARDQVTSGVLVEALASGTPVVATAFPHAIEALAGGAGIVVPHEDPSAIAAALAEVLDDPQRRTAMSAAARAEAMPLLWPTVGETYLEAARRAASSLALA